MKAIEARAAMILSGSLDIFPKEFYEEAEAKITRFVEQEKFDEGNDRKGAIAAQKDRKTKGLTE